jgi:hypothetical protein
VAHGELLVLSNTIGIYFPQTEEVTLPCRVHPVEQFPLLSAASRYSPRSPSNLGGGRMLRRASEQEQGKLVGEEAEEQRGIDLSAGS